MKHKFLKKLIVSSIAVSTLFMLLPIGVSAEWIKNEYGVWSYFEGSSYATGWRNIKNIWYYFDSMGQMRTGWIQDGSNWYYADLSGAMQKGVIQIEGKIYLFSESGAMQVGSSIISGQNCSFSSNGVYTGSNPLTPSKAFDYYGNSTIPYASNQIMNPSTEMSSDIPSDGLYHPKQYKVKFKDPDADNSDDELLKTKTVDENTVITLYKPSKSGYNFVEWNTKSDGDGISYSDDDRIPVSKDITLYAQWNENTSSNTTDITKVQSITVSGANGVTTIQNGGTLQMTKVVLPSDATTQTVTWSVDDTTKANISSTGRLTALSTGTVVVKATAADGSKAYGKCTITISD